MRWTKARRNFPSLSFVQTLRSKEAISALLSREVYYRQFANRQQVGSFLGLTPSPYASGEEERCQGISRAGSGPVRAIMIETAWLWIRYQPKSALTRWFVERTAGGQSTRMRKIMIVAVARKLAIALWRYVEQGLVPQGAILNRPTTGRQDDRLTVPTLGGVGRSDVWLAKPIADLASPICHCEDEPHPSHAIVRACSRVASRNGAAGYKVMRLSHEPMDTT
jgi:hypothetical protein